MSRTVGIQIFDSDELVSSDVFERDIIKIGRLATAQIHLDDPSVSRIHTVIDIATGRDEISVIDMGGKPTTMVNGEEVSRTKVKHGDEIQIGKYRLVVVLEQPDIDMMRGSDESTAVSEAVEAPETDVGPSVDSIGSTELEEERANENGTLTTREEPSNSDAFAPGPLSEFSLPSESPEPAQETDVASDAPELDEAVDDANQSAEEIEPLPAVIAAISGELPPIPEDPITSENRFAEVTLRWGGTVLQVDRLRKESNYTLGSSKNANLKIPLEEICDVDEFTLLKKSENNVWEVCLSPEMQGTVFQGETSKPLQSMRSGGQDDSFLLADDMIVEITTEKLSIEIRSTSKSRIVPVIPFLDTFFLNVAVASILASVAFISTMLLMPAPLHDDLDDLYANVNEFKAIILKQQKKNEFLDRFKKKQSDKAKDKKQGKKGQKKPKKKTSKDQAAKAAPSKEEVVQKELNQLFGNQSDMFSESTGQLETLLGSIAGPRQANMLGAAGLGIRGAGPGGGGSGTRSFGSGRVGTVGRGSGNTDYGRAVGGLGKKANRDVKISSLKPLIIGSLDKDIIKRVVREHMAQIRYCYERELSRTPGIFGKITMKWVIAANGKVQQSQVQATQMKNAKVENCMKRKISTWRFPKPKGGGIVIVTYPFIFKQSN
jgi:pSer/pThr/pTyr-binding forkhead associated (FHA) protein